jgi:ABC-type multidrug transport system fused ATPase/permease subunit
MHLADKTNKQTTIIITHRITTAKEADQIIVLIKVKLKPLETRRTFKTTRVIPKTLEYSRKT